MWKQHIWNRIHKMKMDATLEPLNDTAKRDPFLEIFDTKKAAEFFLRELECLDNAVYEFVGPMGYQCMMEAKKKPGNKGNTNRYHLDIGVTKKGTDRMFSCLVKWFENIDELVAYVSGHEGERTLCGYLYMLIDRVEK